MKENAISASESVEPGAPTRGSADPRLSYVAQRLQKLADQRRFRQLEPVPAVRVSLCSNDYLGLALDARVRAGARAAVDRWGAGSGSSRLIGGELGCYQALEAALADFLGTEAALLFPSGYQANLGLLGVLPGAGGRIFSDAFNHASLIDGCRLSRARVEVFAHNDLQDLDRLLALPGDGPAVVVTEGLFSMDGDAAPIAALAKRTREAGALLLVDDAHALGTLGEGGRGLARVGAPEGADVVVGTFGKAFGSSGAFVAGPALIRDALINSARTFIFTTGPNPAAVGAAHAALEVVRSDPEPRARLEANVAFMRQGLIELGFELGQSIGHIMPLVLGAEARALRWSRALLEEGVYLRAIRPPTVPEGTCRLRISLSAAHSLDELSFALEALARVGRQERQELGLHAPAE